MRPILVITGTEPTSQNHGALMRLRLTIEALADVAEVELAVVNGKHPLETGAGDLPASRLARFTSSRRLTLPARLRWLATGGPIPLELVGYDFDRLRSELTQWLSTYSLVWVVRSGTYCTVERVLPKGIPVIVDIDDLESEKLIGQLALSWQRAAAAGRPHQAPLIPSQIQGRLNARAWKRLEARIAGTAEGAIVCSDEDALKLPSGENVAVVPNSYPDPRIRLGRPLANRHAPTILLQGSLAYPPNVDGAEFFVTQVLPSLRALYPRIKVRLVGKTSPRVLELNAVPNVEVAGFVPSIEDELMKADLIIAPIRFGGGTRIKIIEAFAHQIPVVATTTGAHGLGADHGVHLLLADNAGDFANSCTSALEDTELRMQLTANARHLYEQHFPDHVVKELVESLARRSIDSPKNPPNATHRR